MPRGGTQEGSYPPNGAVCVEGTGQRAGKTMFNCKECEERLYTFLDRELDEAEQREVREHLDRCPPCVERFQFEGNVLHAIGEIGRKGGCPEETRKRILRACGKEALI
jgi:mycothiol system anti-sigma-R factor